MKKLDQLQDTFDAFRLDRAMQKLLDTESANQTFRLLFKKEIDRLQLGIDNLEQLIGDYKETAEMKENLLQESRYYEKAGTGKYIVTEFYYKDPEADRTFWDAHDAMQYAHLYAAEHPLHWAMVEEKSTGKEHIVWNLSEDKELADLDLMATDAAFQFETYGQVKPLTLNIKIKEVTQ